MRMVNAFKSSKRNSVSSIIAYCDFGFDICRLDAKDLPDFTCIIETLVSRGMVAIATRPGLMCMVGTDGRYWHVTRYGNQVELEYVVGNYDEVWSVHMWIDRNGNVDGRVKHIVD